jgi:aspartate/methionine/tyrosine aminotransferase
LFVHLKIIIPYTIARRPMPAAPPTAHRAAEITPFEVMDVLSRAWRPRTKSLLLGSPSNPTGTLIDHEVLKDIAAFVAERGGVLLADEIYQGLVYGAAGAAPVHRCAEGGPARRGCGFFA